MDTNPHIRPQNEKKRRGLPGALRPFGLFYLQSMALFSAARLALYLQYYSVISDVDQNLRIFSVGALLDTLMLCRLLALPVLGQFFLPARVAPRVSAWLSLYVGLLTCLFVFLEIASFAFIAEFYMRPDRLFFEYMFQVREIFGMILRGYGAGFAGSVAAAVVAGWITFRVYRRLFAAGLACPRKNILLPALPAAGLLLLGAAPAITPGGGDMSRAAFSSSQLANQLALNASYCLGRAFCQQYLDAEPPEKQYGDMAPDDMLRRIRAAAGIPAAACRDPAIPLLHYQQAAAPARQPPNLVVIVMESFSAEYIGCLGGRPLTPNFDALSGAGLLFTQLYATGIRTVRGIESVVAGFPPSAGESAVRLSSCREGFFTIAELLRRKGYATEFIYGGRSGFDGMRPFFLANGFETVHDKDGIAAPAFAATWGVSDEDLFSRANSILKAHAGRPFFSFILTASNHDPFEFPDGRIALYEQPKQTRCNALKYSDFALGAFFKAAAKEAYFKNTLFLIIGDHGNRLSGTGLVPVEKFRVGGLLIGPGIRPGRYEKTASQIDMVPTLLEGMGISAEHPVPGRALLGLPAAVTGRAVLQYGETSAYLEGNRLVVLRPGLEPSQFTCSGGRLLPAALDAELARVALAHALLPGYLSGGRLHRLPAAPR